MLIVALVCALLVAVTTVLHYETLRWLNQWLPRLRMPKRPKLLVVMFGAFMAHAVEIFLYGLAFYWLVVFMADGTLHGNTPLTLVNCIYFSAENFTSLGLGEIVPVGPVRMLVGVEALNGLLLIGWTASFTYLEMERYWKAK